tara:strand:+ start:1959 stop:3056 length:1098 start_codon:yes stop_codon:yes gene_type:complete
MYSMKKVKNVIKYIIQDNDVPMLLGGVGIGKSSIVRAIASDLADGKKLVKKTNPSAKEFGFLDLRLSQYDVIDLGGLPYIKDGEQKRAMLPNLPTEGEGVLFLDEFAQCPQSLQKVVGQLFDPIDEITGVRALGTYQLPQGWKIVLGGNRASDGSGANKLLVHCSNRVELIEVEPTANDWIEWAMENDIHADLIAYISNAPQALMDVDYKALSSAQATPRSWERVSKRLHRIDSGGVPEANDSGWLKNFLAITIGEEQAYELTAFLKMKDDMPNLRDIVTGKDVPVVEQGGLCYLTSMALVETVGSSDKMDKETWFGNALSYVKSMATPEFSIFFVRSAVKKNPELAETEVFIKFKVDNQDLEIN